MAKINLLTIHWGNSYGGTMQTYATIKLLKELGHDVTLINLIHPRLKNKLFKKHNTRFSWIIEDIQFSMFRLLHFGHMTKRMYSIKDSVIPDCDVTIVGSDQVWNSDITGPLQLSYFLDFVNRGDKLSFASSFGKFEWESDDETTKTVKNYLLKFKAISVREESGVSICKDVFDTDAVLVLDPTLVYGKYDDIIKDNKPRHTILTFLLKPNKNTKAICKMVSNEIKLPLYSPHRIIRSILLGPNSWLKRMKNSDFIITDSFHGLAFSLIFHKNFIVLCADDKKFARLHSLLSLVHLEDRYVQSIDDLSKRLSLVHNDINYEEVDKILSEKRRESIEFLNSNIKQ